ncbi:MAG: magnesium transporter CorA family protein [Verrucomicrobiales bacterium]
MISVHPPGSSGPSVPEIALATLAEALWIDLLEPSPTEIARVQSALGLELPTRSEMQEIEASSRLYQESGALFMTATMIYRAETAFPESTAATFVLTTKNLVTIRYADPTPFRTFAVKADRNYAAFASRDKMFGGLVDEIIDRIADILELVAAELDAISRTIFNIPSASGPPRDPDAPKPNYSALLERIGRSGELATKARESLVTLTRVAAFFTETQRTAAPQELDEHWRTIRSDLISLSEHSTFLSSKVNFFLDATLGRINIEQNTIIKIFSVAAVVFLPPTLVASIYGMNFKLMPETGWPFGYPMAILMMILSAVLPFLYFKRRGWL